MPNEPDAEREKLVAEMLAAFNFASTASLSGAMSAALAVAEAQADTKLALALRMIDRWLETDHPDNSLVGLPLERSHIGRLNLLRRTLKRAKQGSLS